MLSSFGAAGGRNSGTRKPVHVFAFATRTLAASAPKPSAKTFQNRLEVVEMEPWIAATICLGAKRLAYSIKTFGPKTASLTATEGFLIQGRVRVSTDEK